MLRTARLRARLVSLVALIAITVPLAPASQVAIAAPLGDALPVPWVRQYQNLATSDCDCGPAAVAMVVEYYKGLPDGVSDADLVGAVRDSTGNFGPCTRASGWSADTGFAQLERALTDFRLANDEVKTIDAMKAAISAQEPVIALVHGDDLGRPNYGEHWVVITGFSDSGSVVLNDPDDQSPRNTGWRRGGQGITLPVAVFTKALADTGYGSYGIVVHRYPPGQASNPPVPVVDRQRQIDLITAAYQDILGRVPDPGGLSYYLATGLDDASVRDSLLNSDECRIQMPTFGCVNRWAVTGPPPGPGNAFRPLQLVYASVDGLWLSDLGATQPRKLANGPVRSPVWSHDGGRVAYLRTDAGGYGYQIEVVNADGTGLQVIVPPSPNPVSPGDHMLYRRVRWSPDDSAILYQYDAGNISIKGLVTHSLVTGAEQDLGVYAQDFDVAPDGAIAIGFFNNGCKSANPTDPDCAYGFQIRIVPPGASGPGRLLTVRPDAVGPAWSPDGSLVAFIGQDLEVLSRDGRSVLKASAYKPNSYSLSWDPSGESLIYGQAAVLIRVNFSDGAQSYLLDASSAILPISDGAIRPR